MTRVAVLGAGSWGTALARLLGASHEVVLWARNPALASSINEEHVNSRYLPSTALPSSVSATDDMGCAIAGAEAVVFAVSSAGMREVCAFAALPIGRRTLLVSAAKGLDAQTGERMTEIIAQACGRSDGKGVAALSGPNLAPEVAKDMPTASVAAASDASAAAKCQALFMGPTFRVYTSTDLIGVELAGAMKNVIAIGAGVCEGLGYGDNSRAALMTRGLAEITRLGTALGAHASTFLGLAGVGDLIATGGSRLSRNYRVGVGMGQGRPLGDVLKELGQVAEGVPTATAICKLARKTGVEMPLAEAIREALENGGDLREQITRLMLRPPKHEA